MDDEALATVVWIVLAVVVLPIALALGFALAGLWLWRRWPAWWLALPLAGAGAWVVVASDPVGGYLDVYRTVWSTVEAGRPLEGATALWTTWLAAMAPLSAAVGTAGAAVAVAYLTWR